MLMLYVGGLRVLDKYGNSLDDDEDRDGSDNYINNGGKGDIHLNKTILKTEWMAILLSIQNLKTNPQFKSTGKDTSELTRDVLILNIEP